MMHIQIDVPAIEAAPDGARAGGITEDQMLAGLVRLFRWVLVKKTHHVTDTLLLGFFGPAPSGVERLTVALVEYGHLERRPDGWRVRGAGRYTRAQEGKSKGGLAAKGNLRQYRSDTGSAPAGAPAAAGDGSYRLNAGSIDDTTGIDTGRSTGRTPALEAEIPRGRSPKDRDPEKPRGERRESEHEHCLALMEAGREMRCAELGIDPGSRPDVPPQKANTMIGRAIEACGYRLINDEGGEYTAHDQLQDLHRAFLKDEPFGRFDKDGNARDMPWPTALFLSAGVLTRFRSDEDAA